MSTPGSDPARFIADSDDSGWFLSERDETGQQVGVRRHGYRDGATAQAGADAHNDAHQGRWTAEILGGDIARWTFNDLNAGKVEVIWDAPGDSYRARIVPWDLRDQPWYAGTGSNLPQENPTPDALAAGLEREGRTPFLIPDAVRDAMNEWHPERTQPDSVTIAGYHSNATDPEHRQALEDARDHGLELMENAPRILAAAVPPTISRVQGWSPMADFIGPDGNLHQLNWRSALGGYAVTRYELAASETGSVWTNPDDLHAREPFLLRTVADVHEHVVELPEEIREEFEQWEATHPDRALPANSARHEYTLGESTVRVGWSAEGRTFDVAVDSRPLVDHTHELRTVDELRTALAGHPRGPIQLDEDVAEDLQRRIDGREPWPEELRYWQSVSGIAEQHPERQLAAAREAQTLWERQAGRMGIAATTDNRDRGLMQPNVYVRGSRHYAGPGPAETGRKPAWVAAAGPLTAPEGATRNHTASGVATPPPRVTNSHIQHRGVQR